MAACALCWAALSPAWVPPAGAAAAVACPGAGLRPSARNIPAVDAATLCLVNRVRAAHHLRSLRANPELGHVASGQVSHMMRMDYFADIRPTGQTPLSLVSATRYPIHALSVSVGQNIAWGTGSLATPAHILAAWMASPPHRAIVLSREYRDAGVAVTPATPAVIGQGRGGATYVIEFGLRRP
jgi:uncharacterized protein YkwD